MLTLGGPDSTYYRGEISWSPLTGTKLWQLKMGGILVKGEPIACKNGCEAFADTGATLIHGPKGEVEDVLTAVGAQWSPQYYEVKMICILNMNLNIIFWFSANELVIYLIISIIRFTHLFWLFQYTVDCATTNLLPDVVFIVGGANLTLTSSDYIVVVRPSSDTEVVKCFNNKNLQKTSATDETVCVVGFDANVHREKWALGTVFLKKFYSVYDFNLNRIGFAESAKLN